MASDVPSRCPKCARGRLRGPSYEQDSDSLAPFQPPHERLRYFCDCCGYSMTTPTKDAGEPHA